MARLSKLAQIKQRYQRRFPERVAEMVVALKAALACPAPRPWTDEEPLLQLRRLAHNMAGTAGGCGLKEAGEVARGIDIHLRGVREQPEIQALAVAPVTDMVAALQRLASIQQTAQQAQDADIAKRDPLANLVREKALLAALINSLPDVVFYKDPNSVYLGCNQAATELFGKSMDAIIGHTDFDMFSKEVAGFFRKKTKKCSCRAGRRRTKNGSLFPMAAWCSSI